MKSLLGMFFRRIPREGFKSLTIPVLTLVLTILINIMGGVRAQQADDLNNAINNFEVRVEVSHPVTSTTDNLFIDSAYIRMLTDESAKSSLAGFLRDVELRRVLAIVDESGFPGNNLVGLTSFAAADQLDPLAGAYVELFDGYDESIFRSDMLVCVVSESVYNSVYDSQAPAGSVLTITVQSYAMMLDDEGAEPAKVTVELSVIGLSYGAGNDVFCPFWTVSKLGKESDDTPVNSDSMSAYMSDNRLIGEFKSKARQFFAQPGDVDATLPHSLTVFDGVYNDVVKRLQQNIKMIDVATPFVYSISVCIGFVASYLLTRRRKPEFATLRSIGVNKRDVFLAALAEQAVLCITGVAVGYALFFAVYGFASPAPSAIFTVCYIAGSAVSAVRAAGTNVLKILSDRES